jgi:hypothetical protein
MVERWVALLAAVILCGAARGTVGISPANAAPPTYTALNGVSCTSATACVAVGSTARGGDGPSTLSFAPLAEMWDGSSWSVVPTPTPPHFTGSQLRAVSCASANACVAVGFSLLGDERRTRKMTAFAERWDGLKWTLLTLAKVSKAKFTQLLGVSCTAATSCTAVGNNAAESLVERWNGHTWLVQPTPHPRTSVYRFTFLNGISCPSSNACVAVGESDTGLALSHAYNTYRSLAERWDGRRWSIEGTRRPQSANEAFLEGVSCVAINTCTAAGWDFLNQPHSGVGLLFGLLAESWSGSQWAIQSVPQALEPLSTLEFGAVSCTSATQCMAVGDGAKGNSPATDFGAVTAQESGEGWALQTTPTPPAERFAGLSAVSCTSGHACTAVGNVDNGLGSTVKPLIERWNGSGWTIQTS